MSKEIEACNCIHTEDVKLSNEFNVSVSNVENSCCTYFVKEYSNTSDYMLVERNKVNSNVMESYLPVILEFKVHSKEYKQRNVSHHSLYSTKIPILNSSLLI